MGLDADLGTQASFPLRGWEVALYTIITIVGITGNSMVIIVLKRNKDMRNCAFGIYLGSLAFVDVLVCILCLPVYITSTDVFKSHPTGKAGDIVCKTWTNYFVLFYFAVISVYTLVAISYERYLAICHPVKSRVLSSTTRAKKIVIAIWIFAIVPNIALIAGMKWAEPGKASFGAHCTAVEFNDTGIWIMFYVIILVMQYLIPITCMVVCFAKIRKALNQYKKKAISCNAPHVRAGELSVLRTRGKTIRTVIIMITAYFLCWSLNQVLYFLLNIGYGIVWNGDLMQVSVVMCFLSSCINPIIYARRSTQFRQEFSALLVCCFGKKRKREVYAVAC